MLWPSYRPIRQSYPTLLACEILYIFFVILHHPFLKTLFCHCSLKVMAGPAPHTQLDADLAAGMGMPDNGPKLMSM